MFNKNYLQVDSSPPARRNLPNSDFYASTLGLLFRCLYSFSTCWPLHCVQFFPVL